MHKHQFHNELKQKQKTTNFFFEKVVVTCVFCQFSSAINYRNPSVVNCQCSHASTVFSKNWQQKQEKNQPIKSNNTFFFTSKVCWFLIWLMLQWFWSKICKKKKLDFGCFDRRGRKVDDEIVNRGSCWLFHLMEQSIDT